MRPCGLQGDRRVVWALVPIAALLCLGGCEMFQTPEARPHAQLVAAPRPFESDIPVPTGFRIVEDVSEDYRQGGKRVFVRHRYVGSAPKITVRTFYRDQMPLARWTPMRDFSLKSRITMQFQKGEDYCTLIIDDLENSPLGNVVVDVCVAPGLPEGANLKRVP